MAAAVILPTYNERPNIEGILRGVREHLPDADVVVVDDASPDGTAELAEKLAGDLGQITVLNLGRHFPILQEVTILLNPLKVV